MAVTTSSSATIRGITYTKGSSFKCYASYGGAAGSEGEGSASDLTKGTTYYFYCKASGDNVTYPYAVSTTSGGSPRGWYKENVFPYATYSVKYNANGGSGAPSTQTKTYGTNLTLSSTKPTRTGYTFKGWGTSASDTSVDYAAGATYKSNAAITLYAIWQANTYTIDFNANGGTEAPSSVTKTYGVTLKLPTTVPTRANYKFLGWSASSNASTATYSAGANYTGNANATLYAVWELEYLPPTITNLKAIRCDASGNASDMGTYAKVTFNWECCQLLGANAVSSITVGGTSFSASGTAGSVSVVVGGSLSIETANQITVKVVDTLKSDGSGTTTKTISVGAAVFAIDFLAGGKGVNFGAPATEDGFHCAWDANFGGSTYVPNNKSYRSFNAAGEERNVAYINDTNAYRYGQGSYQNNEGAAFYEGNEVHIRSNGAVNITSPTAGLSARAFGVNKVLWSSSGTYMSSGQTATLSEAVSSQPHGIMLVFSYYNGTTGDNSNWMHFPVLKSFVTNHGGQGTLFNMRGLTNGNRGNKYLYISDTVISGHANNSAAGTASDGSTYSNSKYVMRYVFGF